MTTTDIINTNQNKKTKYNFNEKNKLFSI